MLGPVTQMSRWDLMAAYFLAGGDGLDLAGMSREWLICAVLDAQNTHLPAAEAVAA